MTKVMTREEWLTVVANKLLWPMITKAGGKKPGKWRVSVGFPVGRRLSRKQGSGIATTIGQTHNPKLSADGTWEMFISPQLEAGTAVTTLAHELIHTVAWSDGHHGEFKRIAKEIGLAGKMSATVAGPVLAEKIADFLLDEIEPYPHAPLKVIDVDPTTGKPRKPPGSRLLKVSCPDCGYTIRVTRQWLDVGAPECPNEECARCGDSMEEA